MTDKVIKTHNLTLLVMVPIIDSTIFKLSVSQIFPPALLANIYYEGHTNDHLKQINYLLKIK